MEPKLLRVGKHIVNVEHLADAKWEGESLFVHFLGGAFAQFRGREAQVLWSAIQRVTVDLEAEETEQEVL